MFKEIKPLLHGDATLCITMADAPDDKVRLTITRSSAKDAKLPAGSPLAALNEPIVVTGTVDELDVDLPEFLSRHVGQVASMRTTFTQLSATLETARKEAEERIAAEKKRGQAPASAPKAIADKTPVVSEPALF